jgi:thiol-disulfide isomerase/thioredoxin
MASFIEVIKKIISPYSKYILIALLIVIFLLAATYVYNKYYMKDMKKIDNKFADVANANKRTHEVIIYFFNVDWCPHCKTAKPEWEKFAKLYNGKEKGDYIIKCLDYNCTDETAEVTKIINKYNIESYPTIKMLKDNQVIEFDSKITEYTLEQFVNTMV